MEVVELKDWAPEAKRMLLQELGFSVREGIVIDSKGDQVIDKYIDEPVRVDNMAILPGSTVILDNNPLSIAAYFEEYGDFF